MIFDLAPNLLASVRSCRSETGSANDVTIFELSCVLERYEPLQEYWRIIYIFVG